MIIGGHDIILPLGWEPADRDRILRFFRHVWPDGVFEDALGGYAGTFSEALRFAPASREFFLYPSQEAWASWESDGATAENEDTMLHVVGADDSITLVIGQTAGRLRGIVAELVKVMARNRFFISDRSVA